MDRLFKTQYLAVASVMVVCLLLTLLVLPRIPDKAYNMPLWLLILGEYLFALFVLICAQWQSLRESFSNLRLSPGLFSLGIALIILALGVIVSPFSGLGPDGVISIGAVQLTIINLAVLASIFILRGIESDRLEEAVDTEESNTTTTTNIKRLTRIRMKSVQDKETDEIEQDIEQASQHSRALSDSSSQAVLSQSSNLKQTGPLPGLSPYQGLVNRTAQNPTVGDVKPNIQAGNPKAGQLANRQAVDISTVEKLLIPSSQSIPKLKSVDKDLPPEIRRLPSVNADKNKMAEAKKPVSGTVSKLQALSASGTGAARATHAGVDAPGLKSVLARLDTTEATGDNESVDIEAAGPTEAPLSESAPVFTRPVDNEMDNLFAEIAPTAKPEIVRSKTAEEYPPAPKVFADKVDNRVDEIFSNLAPASAQKQVSDIKDEAGLVEPKPIIESQNSEQSGTPLFKQPIDNEMDSIFARIAPEAKPEIDGARQLPVDDEAISPESKLFKDGIDDQVDEIFSGIAPIEAQKEVKDRKVVGSFKADLSDDEVTGERARIIPSSENAGEQRSAIPELKDFGRLSSRASTEEDSSAQAGTMKTIGKLLIDSQSVENIIKKAETGKITVNLPSAKVISQRRGQGIQNLLETIDSHREVEGSMLVGADGLVIASTFVATTDREGTGVLAHGMLGNSNFVTVKLDLGNLEQMILTTNTNNAKTRVTTIFTDIEAGVLAVFLNENLIAGLDNLLDSINSIARG